MYKFAILLPIYIEGTELSPEKLLLLSNLARSLQSNKNNICHVYFGFDENQYDSPVLQRIYDCFKHENIDMKTIFFSLEDRGKICLYWRLLADTAIQDGMDFFCLLGDDVEIKSQHWIDTIEEEFHKLHDDLKLPVELFGFGCIALNDLQAPGFPTFPVLHRIHYQLHEELFSTEFINQDADPFLFQLYRRWGAARFTEKVSLINNIGGVQLAEDTNYIIPRYERYHIDWNHDILSNSIDQISNNLLQYYNVGKDYQYLTIDVIVPTYRVQQKFLEPICNIQSNISNVSVNFIIIVDNPKADVKWLQEQATTRRDFKLRINPTNCGASHTRNVGIKESSAEYILFLDDDVIPDINILNAYIQSIQDTINNREEYDGYVGYSDLPIQPNRVFQTAVHFSNVSFFWRAALYMSIVPWGITANLLVKRLSCQLFDCRFIKTGGGEDIHFCLQLKKNSLKTVPKAIILHPWWDNGNRCHKHFFNWSYSDGMLQGMYPNLTYRKCPDAVESIFLILFSMIFLHTRISIYYHIISIISILLVDICMDFYTIYPDTTKESYSTGIIRILAIIESTFLRYISSIGRLYGHLERYEFTNICNRFDWFCGQIPSVIYGEKMKSLYKFLG